ncbi:uncharacterized protein LOC126986157 isoform X3 [Eriocheir sinensis]|uniref:uncharacterized protein LOC126986157 isoform X3 n=1 Tax=Eriocheir sinensis TaxID=95602 RepID=UPI0021C7A7AF|nr:uncharacterized protein LOC126986157 isoform X3 [Eriocheir sinensis]
MASPEVLLQRPFWSVANTLVLPIRSDEDGDGAPALRSIVSLSLPVTIFLDVLLGERSSSSSRSRSLGEDQAGIFRAVEASLAGVGVDGRACLLRLICHLQSRPIGQYTVVGEVLMLLFTTLPPPPRPLRKVRRRHRAAPIVTLPCPGSSSTDLA